MHHQIKEFIEICNPLIKRGLPFFREEKGGMWSQKEYNERSISCILDHRHFDDMQQQSLSRKTVIDKLDGDFEMLFEFKAMCAKEKINLDLLVIDQWKIIENYGKNKYKLH